MNRIQSRRKGIAMADAPTAKPVADDVQAMLKDAGKSGIDAFEVKTGEGYSEKVVDAIEMIGEEQAAGMTPHHSQVTAGMRYLHCSRTIHQLVTDRNRAVGIYLTVASLLVTACSVLLNARPSPNFIVPIETIHRWCLPVTFGILTVLSLLVAFLLIRTRIGLIYEVAKMNALLGLPLGRVQRNSPLSIFFILQAIISLAGGTAAALFSLWMIYLQNPDAGHAAWIAIGIGAVVAGLLMLLYVTTVNATTSDERLQKVDAK
jgi:hypothetical protein